MRSGFDPDLLLGSVPHHVAGTNGHSGAVDERTPARIDATGTGWEMLPSDADLAKVNASFTVSEPGRRPEYAPALGGAFLLSRIPLATSGGGLYVYSDPEGYVADEIRIRRAFVEMRGSAWRKRHEDETLEWMRLKARAIELPPPDVLPLRNGVYDLNQRQLRDHIPEDRWAIRLGASFAPDARAPTFERFLAEVLPDERTRHRVLEFIGLCLTTDTRYQRLLLLEGAGANGKSVLIEVLLGLVGWRNAAFQSLHALADDRFATAELPNKLVNICGEVEDSELRSTATVKAVVSGDPISAQRKRGHPFTFRPVARLIGTANALPATADPSDGFFRRIDVIPFPVTLTREAQDRDLTRKLASELPGILNLALAALHGLRARGEFIDAQAVDEANARYRDRADSTTGFISECVEFGEDLKVARTIVFDRFVRWCDLTGRKACGAPKFYERFEQRTHTQGVRPRKRTGVRMFLGCDLRPDAERWGLK
jgi:P4 family phage/plasmid primase-like protien